MANAKALHFETYANAADWFDAHDMADYEDQLQPVEFSFDGQKNRHWVEIDGELARTLRELARAQHVSTRALVNRPLKEKVMSH